jgi:hypothetical protein
MLLGHELISSQNAIAAGGAAQGTRQPVKRRIKSFKQHHDHITQRLIGATKNPLYEFPRSLGAL